VSHTVRRYLLLCRMEVTITLHFSQPLCHIHIVRLFGRINTFCPTNQLYEYYRLSACSTALRDVASRRFVPFVLLVTVGRRYI
jgi:hypothetical protein